MVRRRRSARSVQGIMWKSFFVAGGIFACVLGLEMLLIESAVVVPLDGRSGPRLFTAPDWAPWTLLSAGAVTILHFCTIPTRSGTNHPPAPSRW